MDYLTLIKLLLIILGISVAVASIPFVFAEPVRDPESGHYYELLGPPTTEWTKARDRASTLTHQGESGYLATISSQHENDFIFNMVPDRYRAQIGLTDEVTEGVYRWVTGEPFSYSNWAPGEPTGISRFYLDDFYMPENYIEMYGWNGKWNDNKNYNYEPTVFVVEYNSPPSTHYFLNSQNGHYYKYVDSKGITWENAKIAAESSTYNNVPGHLVTITSEDENNFVKNNLLKGKRMWTGLTDEAISGKYQWVTGEPTTYRNWDTNQPDNARTVEHYIEILQSSNGKWNDLPNYYGDISGYIIEYSNPSIYPVLNPENGHYYRFMEDSNIAWTTADILSKSYTFNGEEGHLVSITSQSENDFVAGLVPDNSRSWIGLTDSGNEGTYKWSNGDIFNYTNWNVNQPDDAGDGEDYVEFLAYSDKWNDLNDDGYGSLIDGYVIEYDTLGGHPVLNPENGNYYLYVEDSNINFNDARSNAVSSEFYGVEGHLVTIQSQSENDFVAELVPNNGYAWMGLTDIALEGDFKWINKDKVTYTNWSPGQPDNWMDGEDRAEFLGWNNKWNDASNDKSPITGYVIEYDLPILNPDNGHYYKYIYNADSAWTTANLDTSLSNYNESKYSEYYKHLVSITSQEENDFVAKIVPDNARAWIGLDDRDVEGTYKWVTGETSSYRNWDVGQPDNAGDGEDQVEFIGSNNKWNDLPNDGYGYIITGYVVEYSPPFLNSDNGHYYKHVISPRITWTDAKAEAEKSTYNGLRGHLVTITDQDESDFITDMARYVYVTWIGLTDKDVEGQFKWVTGEPFSYTNWASSQPNSSHPERDYGALFGSNSKWYNFINTSVTYGYIIEYEPSTP